MDGETLDPSQSSAGDAAAMEEDASDSTALDLTSYQLHDLDSVELPLGLIELDLTANRLSKLDPRIAHLNCLKKLSLRQNLFDDPGVQPLSSWDAISGLEVRSSFYLVNDYVYIYNLKLLRDLIPLLNS